MSLVAVLAVGEDRPGIVAAVTRALADAGANLDDCSMTVLHGHFTMAMVVGLPTGVPLAVLDDALKGPADALGLVVSVWPIAEGTPPAPRGERWSMSVYGADQPGIVATVTAALADAGANVIDLTTRVVGGDQHPVYAMAMEVLIPEGADRAAVAAAITTVTQALGVECTMHPADVDVL